LAIAAAVGPAAHRRLRRDLGRMVIAHGDGAAAEHDALRVVRQAREEHQARGDVLGEVGDVLADERLAVAEPVGEQDRLAILGVRLPRIPRRRVQRHHERGESHGL
jgi:hypothetical protein